MNTTSTSFSSEYSWLNSGSRRNSIESILSIQGKETDVVRDTSDTDSLSSRDVEYEPTSEPESAGPVSGDSDTDSEDYIIKTRVIEVRVLDDGDLDHSFADSEHTTDSDGADREWELYDYRQCAQCRADNQDPRYRYCGHCFKVRKNFFPPRPKRKKSVHKLTDQDSGVDSACTSQELSLTPSSQTDTQYTEPTAPTVTVSEPSYSKDVIPRRRAESADRTLKRKRNSESDSSSSSDVETKRNRTSESDVVVPLVKTVSDPSLTIDTVENTDDNMCIVCVARPKSGVFVHGRIAHICCCYKCALKVWAKNKRCPICNCKVSTVLKAVVM